MFKNDVISFTRICYHYKLFNKCEVLLTNLEILRFGDILLVFIIYSNWCTI